MLIGVRGPPLPASTLLRSLRKTLAGLQLDLDRPLSDPRRASEEPSSQATLALSPFRSTWVARTARPVVVFCCADSEPVRMRF